MEVVSAVDAKRLGSELGRRLAALDIFDAADGSPRDGRYVPMWEAAQQTLDGLLEPYLVDLQRRIELGLKEAAQATCLGIVLGLHSARGQASDDSLLAHAPDFCEKEAHYERRELPLGATAHGAPRGVDRGAAPALNRRTSARSVLTRGVQRLRLHR